MSCNFSLLQDPTKVTGSMFLGAIRPERSFRMWTSRYWLRFKPILDHHRRLNLHMFGWKHQNLCKFDFFQVDFQFHAAIYWFDSQVKSLAVSRILRNKFKAWILWRLDASNMIELQYVRDWVWKFTTKKYCYIMCYPCWNTKFHASLIARLTSTPLFVSWDQASDTGITASQHKKVETLPTPRKFFQVCVHFSGLPTRFPPHASTAELFASM